MNIPNGRAYAGCNLKDGAILTICRNQYIYDEASDTLKPLTQAKPAKAAKPSKYRNVATVIDGIRFSSKAEARYYAKLEALRAEGQIDFFLRQVPFHLPGGVRYVCDFAIQWANRSGMDFVDVKGVETAMFRLKKKQVESLYKGVVIRCVK
jgi:hypothetical protein